MISVEINCNEYYLNTFPLENLIPQCTHIYIHIERVVIAKAAQQ